MYGEDVMPTARNTIGTIFDTASTTATVMTGALNVFSAGVDMANFFVAKPQKDEQDQYVIDAEIGAERTLEEAVYGQTETDLRITAYRAKS
jgi:enoyl-CoA hydratase/carnithine racemase